MHAEVIILLLVIAAGAIGGYFVFGGSKDEELDAGDAQKSLPEGEDAEPMTEIAARRSPTKTEKVEVKPAAPSVPPVDAQALKQIDEFLTWAKGGEANEPRLALLKIQSTLPEITPDEALKKLSSNARSQLN